MLIVLPVLVLIAIALVSTTPFPEIAAVGLGGRDDSDHAGRKSQRLREEELRAERLDRLYRELTGRGIGNRAASVDPD